jgi:hypothetical protein
MITYGNQALIQKAWGRLEDALAFLRNSRYSSIISLVIAAGYCRLCLASSVTAAR